MAKKLTKADHAHYQSYIAKYTKLITKVRGKNRAIIDEASETFARANEVRDFCAWLVTEGYLKHGVAYMPQSQIQGFRDGEQTGDDYIFGWACAIPRKHWKEMDGYRHIMAISYKTWAVVLHELAHCYCRDWKVPAKENNNHGKAFNRANAQMVRCFRTYCEEN